MYQNPSQLSEFHVRKSIFAKGKSTAVPNDQSPRRPLVARRQVRGARAGRRSGRGGGSGRNLGWENRVWVDIVGPVRRAPFGLLVLMVAFGFR